MSGYDEPDIRVTVNLNDAAVDSTKRDNVRRENYGRAPKNHRRIDSATNLNKRKKRFNLQNSSNDDENELDYSPPRKKSRILTDEDKESEVLFSTQQLKLRQQRFGKTLPRGIDSALEPKKNKAKSKRFKRTGAKLSDSTSSIEDEEELKRRRARARRFESNGSPGAPRRKTQTKTNTNLSTQQQNDVSNGTRLTRHTRTREGNHTPTDYANNNETNSEEVTDLTKIDGDEGTDPVLSPTDFLKSVIPEAIEARDQKIASRGSIQSEEQDSISNEASEAKERAVISIDDLESKQTFEEAQMEIEALKREVAKKDKRIESQKGQLVTVRKDLFEQRKANETLKSDVTNWQNQCFQHVGKMKHLEDRITELSKKDEKNQQLIRVLRNIELDYHNLKKKVANLVQ